MRRQLTTAVAMILVLTALAGVAYPLAVLAVAQTAFGGRADGSLITVDGQVVGSELIGQAFTEPKYFHPRPSAAGDGYDGAASSASNLGPSNPRLVDELVPERVAVYRSENGVPGDVPVPVDAVTASGSGLDPHISVANARLQARRVAEARGMPAERVEAVIERYVDERPLGTLGGRGVHVLRLNLALDRGEA